MSFNTNIMLQRDRFLLNVLKGFKTKYVYINI